MFDYIPSSRVRSQASQNIRKFAISFYSNNYHKSCFSWLLAVSVVAYDTPAIRSVYKGLKPVKIVKEYDYKAIAEEAIKMLKRDISKHEEEHLDDNFMNFLKMQGSWRNVAKADIEAIREMMNYPSRTC